MRSKTSEDKRLFELKDSLLCFANGKITQGVEVSSFKTTESKDKMFLRALILVRDGCPSLPCQRETRELFDVVAQMTF